MAVNVDLLGRERKWQVRLFMSVSGDLSRSDNRCKWSLESWKMDLLKFSPGKLSQYKPPEPRSFCGRAFGPIRSSAITGGVKLIPLSYTLFS